MTRSHTIVVNMHVGVWVSGANKTTSKQLGAGTHTTRTKRIQPTHWVTCADRQAFDRIVMVSVAGRRRAGSSGRQCGHLRAEASPQRSSIKDDNSQRERETEGSHAAYP